VQNSVKILSVEKLENKIANIKFSVNNQKAILNYKPDMVVVD